MDPLSALAIAAAVVQFADFGGRLLVKAWDKKARVLAKAGSKKSARTKQPPSPETAIERDELLTSSQELSSLTSLIREAAASSPPDTLSADAQKQFSRLCDECDSITAELQTVIDRIRDDRPVEVVHDDSKAGAVRDAAATQGERATAPLAGFWSSEKIAAMTRRIGALRQKAMEIVLFCLWNDSKKTKQWELRFSDQLTGVLDLLQRIDQEVQLITRPDMLNSPPNPEQRDVVIEEILTKLKEHRTADMLNREPSLARESDQLIRSLIEVGQRVPLSWVADDTVRVLNGEFSFARKIRQELFQVFWHKSWRLNNTLCQLSTGIHPQALAAAIVAGLGFEAFHSREEAIPQTFPQTYNWIFDRKPKERNGKPLWSSFPEWLESPSVTTYWITGNPGSGKSTMMKLIAQHPSLKQHLSSWAKDIPLITATYYAWNAGFSMQKSLEGLKRTLLLQALELKPELASILAPRRWALTQVLRKIPQFPLWETWEVDESFHALLSECGKSIRLALFIDGLDEIDLPAKQVVQMVEAITTTSGNGLKLCVASRPWIEFEDAYRHTVPNLQMNLLTLNDMTTFVTEKFNASRAFTELKHVYQELADRLLEDIVRRANGIFIWLAIVVDSLLASATDGCGVTELQGILDELPDDVRQLYDTIWARIPEHNRREGSAMIQLVEADYWPMEWFTLWLADECRPKSDGKILDIDVNIISQDEQWRCFALITLKRRLAARTRGILDCSDGAHVTFMHRTARDWATQPATWGKICSTYGDSFEPYLVMLRAKTIKMSMAGFYDYHSLWTDIVRALWYASQVADKPSNGELLEQVLDSIDKETTQCYCKFQNSWREILRIDLTRQHWSSKENSLSCCNSSFFGMAVQFSILPYIRQKVLKRKSVLYKGTTTSTRINSLGLLESAIFGNDHPQFVRSVTKDIPQVSTNQRLATVRFLLNRGVTQSKMCAGGLLRDQVARRAVIARRAVRPTKFEVADELLEVEYYGEVLRYLDGQGLKEKLKSASLRLRYL